MVRRVETTNDKHHCYVLLTSILLLVYFIGINGKNNKDIFSTDQSIKIFEVENTPTEYIDQLPSPRNFKAVEINFTPRHFTTPSRESTKADEQEVKHSVYTYH